MVAAILLLSGCATPETGDRLFAEAALRQRALHEEAFAERVARVPELAEIQREWDRRAFELFRRSAEGGNIWAMHRLALCYRDGVGTEPDPEAASRWMRRSAEAGNDLALRDMASADVPECPNPEAAP